MSPSKFTTEDAEAMISAMTEPADAREISRTTTAILMCEAYKRGRAEQAADAVKDFTA